MKRDKEGQREKEQERKERKERARMCVLSLLLCLVSLTIAVIYQIFLDHLSLLLLHCNSCYCPFRLMPATSSRSLFLPFLSFSPSFSPSFSIHLALSFSPISFFSFLPPSLSPSLSLLFCHPLFFALFLLVYPSSLLLPHVTQTFRSTPQTRAS